MPRDSWDLPTADREYVLKLIELVKIGYITDIRHFFMDGLVGYYDCMFSGMSTEVGHLMYRLSDFVPLEQRQIMMIYPSTNGSIIAEDGTWDSLEDFRKAWEGHFSEIPEFDLRIAVPELEPILALPTANPAP